MTNEEESRKRKENNKQVGTTIKILSFEEYREQFQKGEITILGKTVDEWLIYEKENAILKEEIRRLKTIVEIQDKEIEELKKCTRCETCENIYNCKVQKIENEL